MENKIVTRFRSRTFIASERVTFRCNKINLQLEKIKKEKRLGVMTHIVIGYPNLKESKRLALLMARLGVDFIEMQIPFSDPVADGPTIMKANQLALESGTKVKNCFQFIKEISSKVSIPLIFMGYFNTVLNYGTQKFCQDASKAGCSGLIFPDIPLEEESQEHFIKYAEENGLIPIRILSPASTVERIRKNAKVAKGFLYFAGRKGITGEKSELDKGLKQNLKTLRKYFTIPIAVGFGISGKEHIQALRNESDIAVIGSAVLNVYNSAPRGGRLDKVQKFLSPLLNRARD